MTDCRLPTHIWLEAKIRDLAAQGIGVYVLQRGEKHDGQVLVKVTDCKGQAALYTRQRDLMTNELKWIDAMGTQSGLCPLRYKESEVDAYLTRARDRDPDLWIVEVEDQNMKNPFA